jgi:D-tyrosyl-tRNA(Tyr) deacylase
MINIICSSTDPASQNIKENLLRLGKWKVHEEVYTHGKFRLIEIGESLLHQDGLDRKLQKLGPCELLVFVSKHESVSGRPALLVHFTGNVAEAKYGGRERELSIPAPYALRSALLSLGPEATMECTHHGPSNLEIPSFFIEIGSSPAEWKDERMGSIVAGAVLSIDPSGKEEILVGFGGGHYSPGQTRIIFKGGVFGHVFSTYQIPFLTPELIEQAFSKSTSNFGYIDRKGVKSELRRRLELMIKDAGYTILSESEVEKIYKGKA